MSIEFQLLQTFLPALVQKQKALELAALESKKSQITNLVGQLIPIQERVDQFQQQHAPAFNVFGLLRYGHYETRLHTPFLFSLLSPWGPHQLRHRFLELFIDQLFETTIPYPEMKHFELREELPVGEWGQIDLFISFKWNNKQHCIAIENKINAVDQEHQLERYYQYMDKHFPHAIKKLVYLSKNGKYPSDYSLRNDLLNKYLQEDVLYLRSYKSDMIRWIDQLMLESTPDVVKFTLQQYKQTINAFHHD